MKATGIVRRIDDLGRIVIPKEIRRSMGIKEGEAMEIFLEDNKVYFEKYDGMTTESWRKEIRKYVEKYRAAISFVTFESDATTVIFNDGRKITVRKSSADDFDMNAALYYAMLAKGYRGIE